MCIYFQEMDESDAPELVAFLTENSFPFHVNSHSTLEQSEKRVSEGRFWNDDSQGYWVDSVSDGVTTRIGIVSLEDLEDIESGGSPVFDLRLHELFRGLGYGKSVLKSLSRFVFEKFPELTRFEGQTREDNVAMRKAFIAAGFVKEAYYRRSWPVLDAEPMASIAYGLLRDDWENGTVTQIDTWDERY